MSRQKNRKIFWTVFGTHAGALFLLLVIPLLRGLFREKPKDAIFFEVVAAAAPTPVNPIGPTIRPEPEPEPMPTPEPEPEPTPAPKPEPKPAPKPEPKPEKPKWEPKEVVRQNRRVTRNTPQPTPQPQPQKTISADDIQKAFNSVTTPTTSNADQHLLYCGRLQPGFYAVWQQPASAPYGTSATATIRVNAAGQVTYHSLTGPSGNSAFDQSVQAALNAVGRLPTPPSVSVNRNITITFRLQ